MSEQNKQFKESFKKKLDDLVNSTNIHKENLNRAKTKLDEVYKNYRPFSTEEIQFLKDIVNKKWNIMQEKVGNLAEEVFNEVFTHEMALA